MKKQIKIICVSFLLLGSAVALSFCGGGATVDFLNNAPAGFSFTDTSGNAISSVNRGTAVQLRDAAGNVLLQFTTNGGVDFTNLAAGRDAANTLIHFPAACDKSGLTGTLVMNVPCNAATNQLRVCPQAITLNDITAGCAGELTLTQAAATAGNYTWDNAATRTGSADCQVSASVDNFGTGASGLVSAGPVLTADDFPTVGVCATGTVDVTSNAFMNALAGATSFTFMHKPYATDADIPFICGRQGSWDPSDPAAFDTTKTLNMTDAMSNILTGAFGHVFICNTGFGFSAGAASEGFHDATTYRGELKFTSGGTTYRARLRFAVTGSGAGKTLAELGLTTADVTLVDANGNVLATAGSIRDLFAASPVNIKVNAVGGSTVRITATGGFICAGTE